MAWVVYDNFLLNSHNSSTAIDLSTSGDTIKVALVTSSYTPAAATHDYWNDASANEVSGTNYTAGGATLGSKTLTLSAGTVTFDAADTTWSQSGSGFSNARYVILYKDTGVGSTSPLIAYHDMTTDKGNVSGDLTLEYDAAGLITIS